MTRTEQWIAKIVDSDGGEDKVGVESEPHQGRYSPGDNGVEEKSFGTVYFAVERTKGEAEKRVREVWDRRVRDEGT